MLGGEEIKLQRGGEWRTLKGKIRQTGRGDDLNRGWMTGAAEVGKKPLGEKAISVKLGSGEEHKNGENEIKGKVLFGEREVEKTPGLTASPENSLAE